MYVNYFLLALHRPCNFRGGYGSALTLKGSFTALIHGYPLDLGGFAPFLGVSARSFWKFFLVMVAEAEKSVDLGTASRARSTYVVESTLHRSFHLCIVLTT